MADEEPPKIGTAINLHLEEYWIADDLKVVGFGGSGPITGYNKFENTEEEIHKHAKYPFSSDESFTEVLNKFWEKVTPKNEQTILLTHDGPRGYATTKDMNMHGEWRFGV